MDREIQIQELTVQICNEIGEELFPFTSDFSLKSQKHYENFKITYPNHYTRLTTLLAEYQRTSMCPSCTGE